MSAHEITAVFEEPPVLRAVQSRATNLESQRGDPASPVAGTPSPDHLARLARALAWHATEVEQALRSDRPSPRNALRAYASACKSHRKLVRRLSDPQRSTESPTL